jgi:hypothetical protein
MDFTSAIGSVAAFCTTVSYFPQLNAARRVVGLPVATSSQLDGLAIHEPKLLRQVIKFVHAGTLAVRLVEREELKRATLFSDQAFQQLLRSSERDPPLSRRVQ